MKYARETSFEAYTSDEEFLTDVWLSRDSPLPLKGMNFTALPMEEHRSGLPTDWMVPRPCRAVLQGRKPAAYMRFKRQRPSSNSTANEEQLNLARP